MSAQNRVRYYWFGKRVDNKYVQVPIQELPDLGIMLADVLDDGYVDRDKAYCIDANYWKGGNPNQYFKKSRRQLVFNKCLEVGHTAEIKGFDIIKRVYSPDGKAPTLTTMQGGHREPKVATTDPKGGRITVKKDNVIIEGLTWRKLSVVECEKLQTIKPNYTEYGVFRDDKLKKISNSQRYKMLGNGFSVDTIAWILQGMKE
jgi:site-specific DNA-cytosine methylase